MFVSLPIPKVEYEIFTSSGTFTKPDNLIYVEVELVGGGGGSGGADLAGAYSGGGGGGGYSRKIISASALASGETVTVGVGGTAGTSAPGNGGAGGTSSFGSHLSATGGSGSTGASATTTAGGAGGTGSSGDLNRSGQTGDGGVTVKTRGGDSALGFGGRSNSTSGDHPGANGVQYGGGAGGAVVTVSGNEVGGTGADGVVIVKKYILGNSI